MADGSETGSSRSNRQAVKGCDWQEVLWLAPLHATHLPLPGPFVFQTHTHTHTPSAVVIHRLRAGAAHSLLSYFAFSYSFLLRSLAVFYLEGESQAIQNFCLYLPPHPHPTHTHTHTHTPHTHSPHTNHTIKSNHSTLLIRGQQSGFVESYHLFNLSYF